MLAQWPVARVGGVLRLLGSLVLRLCSGGDVTCQVAPVRPVARRPALEHGAKPAPQDHSITSTTASTPAHPSIAPPPLFSITIMPAPTSAPPPPLLPPPQTFDLLSPLSPLLSRLLLAQPATSSSQATSPAGGISSSTSPPPPATNHDTGDAPLSPKDFPAMVQQIHARIAKARQVVRGTDGVEMSVEEQEDVVRELEGELERGRGVLAALRARAAAVGEG